MGTIADLNELTTPAVDDWLLARDVSDLTDKDKKLKAGAFPFKFGTPAAGAVAMWKDAATLEASPYPLTMGGASSINGNLLGGGTINLGGFTFTVPATGTPGLLSLAQTWAQVQTFNGGIKFANETLSLFRNEVAYTPGVWGSGNAAAIPVFAASGKYWRFNDLCFYNLRIIFDTFNGIATGNVCIGLPFNAAGEYIAPAELTGINSPASPITLTFHTNTGIAHGTPFYSRTNADRTPVLVTDIASGDNVWVTGFYEV